MARQDGALVWSTVPAGAGRRVCPGTLRAPRAGLPTAGTLSTVQVVRAGPPWDVGWAGVLPVPAAADESLGRLSAAVTCEAPEEPRAPGADPPPPPDDPVLAGLAGGTAGTVPVAAGHSGATAAVDDPGAAAVAGAAAGDGAADPDPPEAALVDELVQAGFIVAKGATGTAVDPAAGVVDNPVAVVDDTGVVVDDTGAGTGVGVVVAGGLIVVVAGGGFGEGMVAVGAGVVVDALDVTGEVTAVVDGAPVACGVTCVAPVTPTPVAADAAEHIRTRNTTTAAKSTTRRCRVMPTAVSPARMRMR